ncbi:putative holin-like toxin [Sporolactobacillus inulinus]|nr:putative holin-like toxin [Sporolactobacillus inulinus]
MTVYEALTLVIAFSSLLITLIGVVVSIIVVLSNKDKK